LYAWPNISRMIESRRMGCTGSIARVGNQRIACRILVGKSEGRYHLKDTDVGRRIILK
jgi:hypothetical protein